MNLSRLTDFIRVDFMQDRNFVLKIPRYVNYNTSMENNALVLIYQLTFFDNQKSCNECI